MEINVYKGEWGLPSIDFDCLRTLAFIKLSNSPVIIKVQNNPFSSPIGLLPFLEDTENNIKIGGYSKITDYLRTQGHDCNSKLKNQEPVISAGYIHYIFENLYPFFIYCLWGNPKNTEVTRVLYAKRLKFPFNFFHPKKYVDKANSLCETLFNFSLDDKIDDHDTVSMNVNAKKCLNWLSEKLGDNKFFLGTQSCELDATLYAYLAIILYHTLPINELQVHLKNCPNLVKYVENITKTFFAEDGFNTVENGDTNAKPENEQTFYTGKEEEENPSTKRRRQFLSGIFAFMSMSMYAYFHGLLQLPHVEGGQIFGGGGNQQIIEYDDDDAD